MFLHRSSLHLTAGHLVYPLDDSYMHLAMARNLVESGYFGPSHERFVFASSSPLYTLSVAAIVFLFGADLSIPLLLNLVLGALILVAAFQMLRRSRANSFLVLLCLSAVIVFVPLPLMILSGMEHPMQILFVLLYLACLNEMWTAAPKHPATYPIAGALALACCATRYEAVFLLASSGALLLLRRRFQAILWIAGGAILGLGAPGLYSVLHGGHFLPASVLLKGQRPDTHSFAGFINSLLRGIDDFTAASYLLVLAAALLLASFFAQRAAGSFWNRYTPTGIAWVAAICLHVQFARLGWVFRYEAYLIAGSLVLLAQTLAFLLNRMPSERVGGHLAYYVAFSLLLFLPLINRANPAWRIFAPATRNIYEQQVQMSRFVRTYYPRGHVALNDIGAVSFYTNAHIFDIFGLATPEVVDEKLANRYNAARLGAMAHQDGTQIAIAYERWSSGLPDGLPPDWKRVGSWTIPDNVICGSDTVTFFAVNPAAELRLRYNLLAFGPELPKGIKQSVTPW